MMNELRSEYYDIDELKEDLVELNRHDAEIMQSDVLAILNSFDLDDEEIDRFFHWLKEEEIELMGDKEEEMEEEDTEEESYEDEDESEEDSDEEEPDIKAKDSIKFYLQAIGRYPLLTAEEEIEIAKRIEKGRNNPDDPQLVQDGLAAREKMIKSNLRLVVSVAKKYTNRGMLLQDLIQEGNIGLAKAVDKFDYTRGNRFSTYATWWIKQGITRSIADFGNDVRKPVHMFEKHNKIRKVRRELTQKYGYEPTTEEIAEEMGCSTDEVEKILGFFQRPTSLDEKVRDEDKDTHIGDLIEDKNALSPEEYSDRKRMTEEIDQLLSSRLTEREERVIRLRFGLTDDGKARTLEEVGKELNVTRERVRQIEAKALRKIGHQRTRATSETLKAFLKDIDDRRSKKEK